MTSVAPNAGGTDRLFSTAEARLERWSTLVSAAHAWAVKSDKAGRVAVETALAELRPAESFFAYPGPRLLRAIDEEIAQGDGGDVARLVRRMYNALLSSSYRADSADWETSDDGADGNGMVRLPPRLDLSDTRPPHFQAVIVSPAPQGRWPAITQDLRDRKSTRLNSSHGYISYAVFCLKKKKKKTRLIIYTTKR